MLVLDKTGTVTEGKLALTDGPPRRDRTRTKSSDRGVARARVREHPLVTAIPGAAFEEATLSQSRFRDLGRDSRSRRGRRAGSPPVQPGVPRRREVSISARCSASRRARAAEAWTTPRPGLDRRCGARRMLACRGPLKPEASEAVDEFRKLGLDRRDHPAMGVQRSAVRHLVGVSRSIACSRGSPGGQGADVVRRRCLSAQ